MRPNTLAEAYKRVIAGAPHEKALPEFLDSFYLASTPADSGSQFATRPPLTGDAHLDALAGAAAEYLARQYNCYRSRSGRSSRIVISIARGSTQPVDTGDARIPRLREPGRIPFAQHLHRRASAAPGAR